MLSSYMAHDHVEPPPNNLISNMMRTLNQARTPVIIGADANVHHTIRSSSDVNTRGDYMLDFILDFYLVVVNRGLDPTFVVAN